MYSTMLLISLERSGDLIFRNARGCEGSPVCVVWLGREKNCLRAWQKCSQIREDG